MQEIRADLRKFMSEAFLLSSPKQKRKERMLAFLPSTSRDPSGKPNRGVANNKKSDVQEFFTMMSTSDPDGKVNIEEFVRGCMQLKGNASCFDMQAMRFEMQSLRENVMNIRRTQRQMTLQVFGEGSPSVRFDSTPPGPSESHG